MPTIVHLDLAHLDLSQPQALPDWVHQGLLTHKGLVLSVGNFDGVHLGHQAMISKAQAIAKTNRLAVAVMLFEPQPKEFFAPQSAPARLTNLNEKLHKLQALSLDYIIVAKFDERLANLSAEDFCRLLQRLQVQALVVGQDFHFGKKRTGNAQTLLDFGFAVYQLANINADNERISSTAIRLALAQGNLAYAKQLLGEDYFILGQVVHGDKIGRTLDTPTANIALNRLCPALQGVFAVNVQFLSSSPPNTTQVSTAKHSQNGLIGTQSGTLFGCASIGTRPSVNGREWRLEVHLPEFTGDLYGQTLLITFTHFLHGEIHYNNLASLKTGIQNDIQSLLEWRRKQIYGD